MPPVQLIVRPLPANLQQVQFQSVFSRTEGFISAQLQREGTSTVGLATFSSLMAAQVAFE